MFRTAATKIAHNSTLPALAGNRDLRPLQDLITAEKAVLQSLQKLSHDVSKSSECLRHWGAGEGDDLQDILNASSALLTHLSSSLSQLANHHASIREYMKSVRTREENLDELRRRRKAVVAKADSAEKRLTKMSTEHKNFQQQTELLNNLRDQIRGLDWEILQEEAQLGDFKRESTKNWMILKFGGILELAEKATIVGEIGKLLIEEIPLDKTQPGQARSFYTGHEKTDKLLAEAQRCIAEVVFDPQPVSTSGSARFPVPNENRDSIDGLPSGANISPSPYLQSPSITTNTGFGSGPVAPDEFGGLGDHRASRNFGTMPAGPIRANDDGSRITATASEGSTNNFSSSFTAPPSVPDSRFGGSRFSTFPTRKSSLGPSLGPTSPPPNQALSLEPLSDNPGVSSSFAAEVANALAYADNDHQSSSLRGKSSLDGPAPSYEPYAPSGPHAQLPPSGLPRGAAPPVVDHNPWDGVRSPAGIVPSHGESSADGSSGLSRPSHHVRESATSIDNEETQLPYASPPPSDHQLPQGTDSPQTRHVHFGAGDASDPEAKGHGQKADNQTSHERIPSYPSIDDIDANNAAAAREVAREMDSLIFSPPPGPPPGRADARAPSPLQPPAPPFAQQQRIGATPDYSDTLSPRSEGTFRSSNTDLRIPPVQSTETPSAPSVGTAPPSPNVANQTRPPMSINVHSPSPSYSFNSATASTYGTPPEIPAIQPLRTGSPASPSILAPGARTISAAAFKRPGMRTASGGQPPDARPLPDVTPLSLRKKPVGGGPSLPSSPYPSSREHLPMPGSPNPNANTEGQDSGVSVRSPQDHPGGMQSPHPDDPAPDYESTYEFVSSYGEQQHSNAGQGPHSNGENTGSSGYGRGQFATNLEGDNLR